MFIAKIETKDKSKICNW